MTANDIGPVHEIITFALEYVAIPEVLGLGVISTTHAQQVTQFLANIQELTVPASEKCIPLIARCGKLVRLYLVVTRSSSFSGQSVFNVLSGWLFLNKRGHVISLPAIQELYMLGVQHQPFDFGWLVQLSHSLVLLDLRGNDSGAIAVSVLIGNRSKQQSWPCLRYLLAGRNTVNRSDRRISLAELGRACPALESLDCGYASWTQGVRFIELQKLVSCCSKIQHLDLSMAMELSDFGGVVDVLQHAPNLEAIAAHGLYITDAALSRLCSYQRLRRPHFVNCFGFSPDAMYSAFSSLPALYSLCLVAFFDATADARMIPSDLWYLSHTSLCELIRQHHKTLDALLIAAPYTGPEVQLIRETLTSCNLSWQLLAHISYSRRLQPGVKPGLMDYSMSKIPRMLLPACRVSFVGLDTRKDLNGQFGYVDHLFDDDDDDGKVGVTIQSADNKPQFVTVSRCNLKVAVSAAS